MYVHVCLRPMVVVMTVMWLVLDPGIDDACGPVLMIRLWASTTPDWYMV